MSTDTQNARLIAYLKQHHFITRRDAARKLEIMNLWSRIAECEVARYRFDRRVVKSSTGKRVLQYWLRQSSAKRARAA